MIRKILFIVLLALVIGAMGVSAVGATGGIYGLGNPEYKCDAVRFSYRSFGGYAFLQLVITDANNVPLSNIVNGSLPAGDYTILIGLNSAQPQGTALKIRYSHGTGFYDLWPFSPGACQGLMNNPAPLYENIGGENARLKMVVVDDVPGNLVLAFYVIDEQSAGKLAFFIPQSDLAGYPDKPDATITIYESDDGKFTFYKLPTGEYQINVGPDAEGKTHVVIFTGVPPTNVYGYTFVAGARMPKSVVELLL